MSDKYQLTPVEHELMGILWQLKQGTVRDVMGALPPHRHLAYTSVSTILRILQQKKVLTVEKIGRHHVYVPLLSKEVFAASSVKKMVQQVFSGSPAGLVAYLVNQDELSLEEINHMQQLLDAKKKELTK
jgi:predicted transcriptional regulator